MLTILEAAERAMGSVADGFVDEKYHGDNESLLDMFPLCPGEILDENERIRASLKQMQRENTQMEENELNSWEDKGQKMAESQVR